jgi:phosphonate transport system ATP-binding protein
MSSSLLETEDLGLCISQRWLFRNLGISIPPQSFVGVTGPSGVGKTSLLRLLASDLQADEGKVFSHLQGGQNTAMIFQDLQLADGASTLHNALGGSLGRHSGISTFFNFPKQEKEAANNWLEKFGLVGKSRQWASTLSRGERQRLAICRTLLSSPTLLLADEPVASLDSEWAGQTLQILKDSQIQKGGSLVCSLHDEDQVQRFADFVLRLHPSDPTSWSWETLSKRTEA